MESNLNPPAVSSNRDRTALVMVAEAMMSWGEQRSPGDEEGLDVAAVRIFLRQCDDERRDGSGPQIGSESLSEHCVDLIDDQIPHIGERDVPLSRVREIERGEGTSGECQTWAMCCKSRPGDATTMSTR
jgi:hypothetical protein